MSWSLPSTLTHENAMPILEQGLSAIKHGERLFDCQALQQFDSTVLALMLHWQRTISALGGKLDGKLIYQNMPEKLASLAQVYGIADLLAISVQN